MTRDEIRTEAIDRLARSEWEELHRVEMKLYGWTWETRRPAEQGVYRRSAGRRLDALGDMLPTGAEWCVIYDDPEHGKFLSTFCGRREDAEHQIRCNEDEFHDGRSSLGRRFLTDWQEVTDAR